MRTLGQLQGDQPRAVGQLQAALTSPRHHHAFLLLGAERSRRQAVAGALAQSLLCAERTGSDACGQCPACGQFDAGTHPEFFRLRANDNGKILVDAVRELTGQLGLKAAGPYKVACIEQAEAMTPQAQNALLKTLEEPPPASCFVLTAGRRRSLLPTVRSRTQMLQLAPGPKLGSWQTLAAAGIDAALARPLAALVGDQVDAAKALLEAHAADVIQQLGDAFAHPNTTTIMTAASELGADRQRFELTLEIVGIWLRDQLAQHRGAQAEHLYTPAAAPHDRAALLAVAERLAQLRRTLPYNPNRTLAIERLLLPLCNSATPAA